jgi:hypothetical protein
VAFFGTDAIYDGPSISQWSREPPISDPDGKRIYFRDADGMMTATSRAIRRCASCLQSSGDVAARKR